MNRGRIELESEELGYCWIVNDVGEKATQLTDERSVQPGRPYNGIRRNLQEKRNMLGVWAWSVRCVLGCLHAECSCKSPRGHSLLHAAMVYVAQPSLGTSHLLGSPKASTLPGTLLRHTRRSNRISRNR